MRGDKTVPLKQLLDIIQRLDNLYSKLSAVDAVSGGLIDARLTSLIDQLQAVDAKAGGNLLSLLNNWYSKVSQIEADITSLRDREAAKLNVLSGTLVSALVSSAVFSTLSEVYRGLVQDQRVYVKAAGKFGGLVKLYSWDYLDLAHTAARTYNTAPSSGAGAEVDFDTTTGVSWPLAQNTTTPVALATYDFGAAYNVYIIWRVIVANAAVTAYLQTSADCSNYTTVDSYNGTSVATRVIKADNVRCIRLTGVNTSSATSYVITVYDLSVFKRDQGIDVAPTATSPAYGTYLADERVLVLADPSPEGRLRVAVYSIDPTVLFIKDLINVGI